MVAIPTETVDLTEQQRLVRDSIRELCSEFGPAYWRERDREGEYPHEFVEALARDGWFGILIPEEYGGVGMGTPEAAVMMEEIAAAGGGFAGPQSIHGGIYNSVPLVKYADESLKADLLPDVAAGDVRVQAFGFTEPNAGSDSTSIETRAEHEGDEYVVNGQKIWTSRVDASDYLVLMARTTPKSDAEKRTKGISMFLVDIERGLENGSITIEPIPKTTSNAVHSFEVWFENLRIPESNLIGVEGNGFYQVLDGLNEERLVIAAECIGLGEVAIDAGVSYAKEREVFGAPIGSNQAVQHPLAKAYADVQAAKQVTYSAAERIDDDDTIDVGAQANMSKYLAAEAAYQAADAAVQTHGGFGVAVEYDVERYFREARLTRLVPVTQELVLNYLGENVLRLPRSY